MSNKPFPKDGSTTRAILRRFAALASASWTREALQSVFLIYLARQSTTTFGQFMVAISLGQILLFISELGLNQHLVPLLLRKEADPAKCLMQVSALKAGLLCIGMIGMGAFLIWQDYPPALKAVGLVIGVGIGLETMASSFFVFCQVQGRQGLEGKVRAVSAVVGFSYGILAIVAGAAPLTVAFFKPLETICNMAGATLLVHKTIRLRFLMPRFREIWTTARSSFVFTMIALAAILYNKANIFFLQRHAGSEGVAQYSVTWQMVDGVSCIVSGLLLRNVLYPLFAGLWENNKEELIRIARGSASVFMTAAFPIMFILSSESDRLIMLIFGPGYSEAVWMQKVLVITILLGFLHNLAAYIMMSMKKEKLLLAFYLVGLFFNLACCASLIPSSPLLGTVLSIVLTKVLVGSMTIIYCQRRLRMIPLRSLYRIGLAVSVGVTIYFLARGSVPRESAEAAAVVPVLAMAFHWRRKLFVEERGELAV